MQIKKKNHRRAHTDSNESNSAFNLLKKDHLFNYTQLPKEENKDAVEKIINNLLIPKIDKSDNDIINNSNQCKTYKKINPVNPKKTIFNEILRTEPLPYNFLSFKNKSMLLGHSKDESRILQEIKDHEKKKKYSNVVIFQPSLSDKSSTIQWMFNLNNNNPNTYLQLKQKKKEEYIKAQMRKIKEKEQIAEYYLMKRRESARRIQQEYRL